jgi:hypothetical protein
MISSKTTLRLLVATMGVVLSPLFLGPTPAAAFDPERITVHGFFDIEYLQATENEGSDRGDASDPTNGAFDQHHFNLLADIRILPELVAKAHVEFDHGADSELGSGGIILEYAFADYYILQEALRIRAGKTLTPYGFYNEVHDASPAFLSVTIPWAVYKSDAMGGFPFMPKWITGFAALGGYAIGEAHHDVDFALFVGNGESLGSNEAQFDDNPNKAVGGRLQYVSHEENFRASLSYYNGDKAVASDSLAVPHWSLIASIGAKYEEMTVETEYATSELGAKRQYAWYAIASYRHGRYTPYLRYQFIDPNEEISDDTWGATTGGVNVMINDHLFFKLDYTAHTRGAKNGAILNGIEDFGETRAAFTIHF